MPANEQPSPGLPRPRSSRSSPSTQGAEIGPIFNLASMKHLRFLSRARSGDLNRALMAEDEKLGRLTPDQCIEPAIICRRMARTAVDPEFRTTLEDMARVWDEMSREIVKRNGKG